MTGLKISGAFALLLLWAQAGLAAAPPALYSAAQAKSGADVFSQNCAMCHGADLKGAAGPALIGQGFAAQSNNYTVGAIFSEVAEQMPAGQAGSLSHTEYENVMAYLLQQNGYPSGATPLNYDEALGSGVALVSQVK